MAQVGELIVELTGDAKSWSNAIDDAGKKLRELGKEVNKAGYDIKQFNTQTLNLLKGWDRPVAVAANRFSSSLNDVKQGLVAQGKALDTNQKGMDSLAIETVVAAEKLKILTDSLKSTSSALWLMTMGLQQFGRAMTIGFTVPIMAAAGLAVKTFMDWERGTLAIQRAAELTREEAEKITDNFIEISVQVPLTVEELQKAAYAAAQAGVTGEEAITNFAEAAVKLSKVGGDAFKDLPVEDLANRLAKLAIAFGETGENWENVNKIASTLLVVAKAVPGGLAEVIEAMRRAAGPAATLNLTLADTTALMGTLVATGVPAARAGTELGRVLFEMSKNIDKVGEALGYTTENFGEFKERMETDVMGVLVELLERYGQVENRVDRIAHLQEIFGTVSLRALLPLIDNVDILRDLQARANQELESGALLAAEFDIQAQSLSGTLTVFRNAIQAIAKAVGDDLAPYISYFLKIATTGLINLVKSWRDLNPHIRLAITLMAGLLATVGPLALLLNTLFLNPISGLVTFLTFLTKASGQLVLQTGLATMAGQSMNFFALSLGTAATAAQALVVGLAVLAVKFAAILAVIAAVAVALYALGKAFGIGIKLPAMPAVKLPKYKGATIPEYETERLEELEEADEEAAKKREKELERELRDKRRARDKELRALDKGIKEIEKIANAEIKVRQKLVDEQREALDQRREQWEEERDLMEDRIRIQQETVEAARKSLKIAQKELRDLKQARDRELDIAEGRVDYARMNLEAAQNALKREKILGRDEFDATFRAAEARVKAMEEAVTLAEENRIKIERAYQKQVEAQEEIVDAAQEQVDVQADALDDLRDALAERQAIVDKEIDILQDELKVRQDALDDVKEANKEKLDLLREERDARQEAWDDEIEILQDQLDAARDLAQDIKDMPIPELPDVAGKLSELEGALQEQLEEMQADIGAAMGFGVEVRPGEGWLAQWWNNLKRDWEKVKELAREQGVSVSRMIFEGMLVFIKQSFGNILISIFEILFGPGSWEDIHRMSEEEGKSIPRLFLEGFLLGIMDVPRAIKEAIEKEFIQPFRNAFPQFFEAGKGGGEKTKEGLAKGGEGTEQTGSLIVQNFIRGLQAWHGIYSALSGIRVAIWNSLGTLSGNAWSWGYDLVNNMRRGMESAGKFIEDTVNWISDLISRYWRSTSPPKEGALKEIDKWGINLARTYAESISKGIPHIKTALEGISIAPMTQMAGEAARAIPATAPAQEIKAGTTVNKTYEIKPGVMIASRGEIRNFVRMLKEFDKYEEER